MGDNVRGEKFDEFQAVKSIFLLMFSKQLSFPFY
jgi:hypothetical protein